ncbi:MAG TPA: HlyD family efflux transporter periplasmic adaptor subunit [Arenimonas sp.]|nr:HlyD family efflux transporter periplasmic adaptor subunit [Arenimonas sp.]
MKTEALMLAIFLLAGCAAAPAPGLPGTLEWERIAVPTETSETLLRVTVHEGETVEAGALLAELDPTRADARLARARAELQIAEQRLAEALNGARGETLRAARADLARASAGVDEAARAFARVEQLRARQLVAESELDRSRAVLQRARADASASRARLDELLAGVRPEQIAQAEAALAAAQAGVAEAELNRSRLQLRAPIAGRIDALPFEAGDRPAQGAAIASLLVGEHPYARVFVPAAQRAQLAPGARFRVHVEGHAQPLEATLRSIASEPAFTPYYALAGDDASRLVYRAELELQGDAAAALPSGLPLRAEPLP